MTTSIVNVNVTQTIAPAPNKLQKTGAFISQGGTNTAPNTISLLTQAADLTPLAPTAGVISTAVWTSGVTTVTASAPHGLTIGATYQIVQSGNVPIAFNTNAVGVLATITTTTAYTYVLASTPGTLATPGTFSVQSVSELQAMTTTFFAQGSGQGVYVLELGPGNPAAGVTALAAYITANPGTFYSYLVPRLWDGVSSFLTMVAGFESTTAKTYFFVTTTSAAYTDYVPLMKSVVSLVEVPAVRLTAVEFDMASVFHVTLNYNPSSTNKVPPLAFAYLFGVTAFPQGAGNGANFALWKAAAANYITSGSEGGIVNTILRWGTTEDLRPFNYWYSVDWMQITADEAVANAIINGSNNPINPLYLNQDGINRLQAVLAATVTSGVTFGLVLGQVVQTEMNGPDFGQALDAGAFLGQAVVNAVPFVDYYTANPDDYAVGVYNGFSITFTPLRGFESITININVTDFV
jgi:hypothetical protein